MGPRNLVNHQLATIALLDILPLNRPKGRKAQVQLARKLRRQRKVSRQLEREGRRSSRSARK